MYNNVPVGGWPQIKKLEEIQKLADQVNEIAEEIRDMPTYTSDDREFLTTWESILPISDEVGTGQYTLTATKSELGATYSWEEPESGLPEDPAVDGNNILQAVTTGGETTKNWIAESLFLASSGNKTVDCNNEKNNAIIRVRENSTNIPTGAADGFLIVFRPSTDNVCVQIYVESSGTAYIRTYWYTEWKTWKTMAS